MERKYDVKDVFKYLSNEITTSGLTMNERGTFWSYARKFCLDEGAMKYKIKKRNGEMVVKLVVMDDAGKCQVFDDVHVNGGHMALKNAEFKISESFYWLGIRSNVESWIAEYDRCQRETNILMVPRGLKPFVTTETFETLEIGPLVIT